MIYRWWLNTEGVLIIQVHKAISINVAIFVKKNRLVKWPWWPEKDGLFPPAECTLSCRLVDIRPCYRRQFNLSVRRRRKLPTVASKEQLTNDIFIVSCLWMWQNPESGSTKCMHPEKIHCPSDVQMKKNVYESQFMLGVSYNTMHELIYLSESPCLRISDKSFCKNCYLVNSCLEWLYFNQVTRW